MQPLEMFGSSSHYFSESASPYPDDEEEEIYFYGSEDNDYYDDVSLNEFSHSNATITKTYSRDENMRYKNIHTYNHDDNNDHSDDDDADDCIISTTPQRQAFAPTTLEDQVRSVFADPAFFRSCVRMECSDMNDDNSYYSDEESSSIFQLPYDSLWSMFGQMTQNHELVVAVEATTICATKRRDSGGGDGVHRSGRSRDSLVTGGIFVGVVHHCGGGVHPSAEIVPGTRVASIINDWGGSGNYSKYVTCSLDNSLMVVPNYLDAADMACLIASYLPAFQALHHGRTRPYRYSRKCLQGRSVFVTGGSILEAEAIIDLARLAGAAEVYVAAPRNHILSEGGRGGATLLDEHPDDWLPVLYGGVDIVVAYDFPFQNDFAAIQASLSPRGRLVCCTPRNHRGYVSRNWAKELGYLYDYFKLSMTMNRATLFDLESVDKEELHKDASFLLNLLSTRQIRPRIDRFITLSDVPRVHRELQSQTCADTIIICEPWKET